MEKKTYGARGYMDWVAQIPVGNSSVKVHFTGGALTSYGVTPAEYTTANPFFQKVIEGSQYYQDGRIELLRTIETGEPAKPAAPKTGEAEKAAEPKTAEAGEPEIVEVTCLQDAQEVLNERFGIPARNVRSRAAALAAGSERGITFTGL